MLLETVFVFAPFKRRAEARYLVTRWEKRPMSLSRWNKGRTGLRLQRKACQKNAMRRRVLAAENLEARTLLASLQGAVWNDYNGDGKIAFGEPRLEDWRVYLDNNNNGKLDTSTVSTNFPSGNVPRDIPDLGTITSTRTVSGLLGTIDDLNVRLSIDHTWVEDLDVFLTSPSGTRVELFTDVGGSGQNFTNTTLDDSATKSITAGTAPFSGSFRPEGSLADFNGENPNGVWTLQVTDDNGSDVGTLVSWSITIRARSFSEPNRLTDANGNYSFTGLGAGTKRIRVVPQTGFSTTFPSNGVHVVSLTANQDLVHLNFGVREPTSSVKGSMWEDYNGDAKRDANEPAMANRIVFIDANNDGILNSTTVNHTFNNTTTRNIPDLATIRSTINVPTDAGRVTDLNVSLDITHPNITDLSATLISPSGTRIKLFQTLTSNGPGFTGTTFDDSAAVHINNATPPFTGTFRPEQLLKGFNGESALGSWQLEITDNGAGNTGTLNNWSMVMRRVNAERSQRTSAKGNYSFFGLPPGEYDIAQRAIPGYTSTAPRSVSLVTEQNIDVSMFNNGGEFQPRIAVDPTQINRLFSVASRGSGAGFLAATSNNGGVVWNTRGLTGNDGLPLGAADPDVAFDEFGNLFVAYQSQSGRVLVALSTDGGESFTLLHDIAPGSKPAIAAAKGAVWISYTRTNNQIAVSGASVTNLGTVGQFTAPAIAPSSSGYSFSDVEIGPNGQLAVLYVLDNNSSAPTNIRLSVDSDGLGAGGFSPAVLVANTNVGTANFVGAFSTNPGASLAWDRSGGDHDGRLYVVYANELPQASQDLDIFLVSTDNAGAIWTAPVRANQFVSRAQFMPGIALDQTNGDVFVAWYDAVRDTGNPFTGSNDNLLNTDVEFVGAISVNGGNSFLPRTVVSAGITNVPGAGSPQNVGQRTSIAFHNGVIHPVWSDNSNATGTNPNGALNDFDVLTATITVTSGGRAPHHVIVTPGSALTGLNFANHLNPTLTGLTTVTYIENSNPQIAPNAILTQPTVPSFANATVTVRITANAESTDRLGVRNTNQVKVSGNELAVGGFVVATFVNGNATTPMVVRFNSNATLWRVQAVVRAVTFQSLSDNPSTALRRVSFTVTDGHRGISDPAHVFIRVQRVNDPPTITNFGGTVTYDEDLPGVNIAPAAILRDPDSFNFNNGKLTVRLTKNAKSEDRLSIQNTGTGQGQISTTSGGFVKYQNVTIGSFTGGSGATPLVVTFNASSSIAGVQALIRRLQFRSLGDNPSPATRTVSVVMNDGDGGTSAPVTKSIIVRPIADAPLILPESGSVGYTLNAASVAVFSNALVTDVDSAHFNKGSLTVRILTRVESQNRLDIRGNFKVNNFKLSVDNVVIGTINPNGGVGTTSLVVTFNSNATVSRVQRLIRQIRFRTFESVQTGNRAIGFTIDDGTGAISNTAIRTVIV